MNAADELRDIMIKNIEDRRNPYPDTWAARLQMRWALEKLPGRYDVDEEIEDFLTLLDKWEKDGCQSGNGAAC